MELTFTTSSPINVERLTGQNRRLYDWLKTGNPITCMSSEMQSLRIGYLNSRISDLVNKYHVPIEKKYIQVKDIFGNLVTVVEYKINN